MWHHVMIFVLMVAWMVGPLLCYGVAPRKHRDPYLWVFGASIFGPLVALTYLLLPALPAETQSV